MTFKQPPVRSREYHPAPNFVEIAPNVFAPPTWEPGPYELAQPEVQTDEQMVVEYARCQKSLPYFALRMCWTVHVDDPSGSPQWRRVPAYPYLREFFTGAQEVANTLTEKSRQMMMSWAWMVVFLWDINFHSNWNNLLISRREIEVDDGGDASTHNSLIGKVRHIHMALPPYLQAPIDFQYGFIRHRDANSFIRGETGTIKAGRGAAVKRALMDEAAFIDHSETVMASLRQVAKKGTCLNSTANGKGNEFARIRFSSTTTFRKFTFKWLDHPEKARGLRCTCGWRATEPSPIPNGDQFRAHECGNKRLPKPLPPEARSPWYDNEARDLTPEQMASEIDISYEKSTRGRVWPFFDAVLHTFDHTQILDKQGHVLGPPDVDESLDAYRRRYLRAVIEPDKALIVGWDFGVSDETSLLLGQVLSESRMRVRWIDEFEANEQSWDFFHAFVMGLWAPIGKEASGLDLMHYGDPSGRNRQSDLQSWISNLANFRDQSQRIVVIHQPKTGSMLDWLDFVGNLMRNNEIEVSTWCGHLISVIEQYRFPTDPYTGEPIPGAQVPVHDQFSHAASSLRYAYQFRYHSRLRMQAGNISSAGGILRRGHGRRIGSARVTDNEG